MCGDCGGCGVYLKSPHFVVIWHGILCILTPCSLLLAPYSLFLTPCSLLLTPCSLLRAPYSSLLAPYSLLPLWPDSCWASISSCLHSNILDPELHFTMPCSLLLTPYSLLLAPCSLLLAPYSLLLTTCSLRLTPALTWYNQGNRGTAMILHHTFFPKTGFTSISPLSA